MKITKVTDGGIYFDNGNVISYNHVQDCCECNYADFSNLNSNNIDYDYEFNPDLEFTFIDDEGFLFGSTDENGYTHKIFIPCYSEQNGYYTTDIDIYYNNQIVLQGGCREVLY